MSGRLSLIVHGGRWWPVGRRAKVFVPPVSVAEGQRLQRIGRTAAARTASEESRTSRWHHGRE
ncbi:hypothetical protein E1258_16785 [Micromonospora sp. KC207]|nr:hypothetical protein E1258_16785 [Micromonospora sp. KC207]